MSEQFVYVTYIRTTPERLWQALTEPEFTRSYFWETRFDSDWRVGSRWQMVFPDGSLNTHGEVLESDPPRRLVLSWINAYNPELAAEGVARASFEIERIGNSVKLTVIHESERDRSKLIESVSRGWPMILASLKSLLETGEPLEDPRKRG